MEKPLTTPLVKQPYAITVAKHNFNVHEMRIMTRITQALQKDMLYSKDRSEVQKTLFGDKIIRIPTQSLLPKGSQNYAAVKRALKSLEDKSMTIRGKDKCGSYETNARLIMKSKYYLSNEMVEIQLDRDILPDYLSLASYSRYIAEISFDSSSRYIMRMYQFICHWRDKTKKVVTIDELRDFLEIGDKYGKPKDFRRHILEPCIADLRGRADVWFEIETTIKQGRSVTGYVFKIYTRGRSYHDVSAHATNIRNVLKSVFGLRDFHLEQLNGIIGKEEYHTHIYKKCEDIHEQLSNGRVQHTQAYVVKALQREFGDVDAKEVYTPPDNLRRQLKAAGHEGAAVKRRAAAGPSNIGEHIANMIPKKSKLGSE